MKASVGGMAVGKYNRYVRLRRYDEIVVPR